VVLIDFVTMTIYGRLAGSHFVWLLLSSPLRNLCSPCFGVLASEKTRDYEFRDAVDTATAAATWTCPKQVLILALAQNLVSILAVALVEGLSA